MGSSSPILRYLPELSVMVRFSTTIGYWTLATFASQVSLTIVAMQVLLSTAVEYVATNTKVGTPSLSSPRAKLRAKRDVPLLAGSERSTVVVIEEQLVIMPIPPRLPSHRPLQ